MQFLKVQYFFKVQCKFLKVQFKKVQFMNLSPPDDYNTTTLAASPSSILLINTIMILSNIVDDIMTRFFVHGRRCKRDIRCVFFLQW